MNVPGLGTMYSTWYIPGHQVSVMAETNTRLAGERSRADIITPLLKIFYQNLQVPYTQIYRNDLQFNLNLSDRPCECGGTCHVFVYSSKYGV